MKKKSRARRTIYKNIKTLSLQKPLYGSNIEDVFIVPLKMYSPRQAEVHSIIVRENENLGNQTLKHHKSSMVDEDVAEEW